MKDIKVEIGMILFGMQILLLAGISNLIGLNQYVNTNVILVILAFGLQCFGIIKLNEKLTRG